MFFLDHLATSDFSGRFSSEVLHFTWDWDPLTFLSFGKFEEMGRTLKNLSVLHLHHPDLLELQYLTQLHGAENAPNFGLGRLDMGLQELTGSVSSYFASFRTRMGITIMLIFIALSYLNCRRTESAAPAYQPPAAPVIIQAPAPAPAPAAPPTLAPRILLGPYPQARARQNRRVQGTGQSCCG